MNHCVPDWNLDNDSRRLADLLPISNQKKSMGSDNEFVELLWENGQVVLNSQTHRRPIPCNESEQNQKSEEPMKGGEPFGNLNNFIQEDETASWLQYPLDDSLDKEFSDFFYGTSANFGVPEEPNGLSVSGMGKPQPVLKQTTNGSIPESVMPPPKSQVLGSISQVLDSVGSKTANFAHFSRLKKVGWASSNLLEKNPPSKLIHGEVEGSSMMSNCGSNQIGNWTMVNVTSANSTGGTEADKKNGPLNEKGKLGSLEKNVTSSSGGSRGSLGRISKETTSNQSLKRKSRDADESECQSEETDFESVDASKPPQQSHSTRRSRAAEVHNLSERRRRDRINEKMRALQELIPHSNKSDKASMLDEAIEYLKSLQLQVQMMWMGTRMATSMAPMMFPGFQHYISPMSMGVGHAAINSPVQFPRVPLINQTITPALTPNLPPMCSVPLISPINFQNHIQNANMHESYSRYLGFHHMQAVPQGTNLFAYGSQSVQNEQKMTPLDNSSIPSNRVQNDNLG